LICRNCHAKVHEGLLQTGVNMRPEPDLISRVATMLEASEAFLKLYAAAQARWAELLRNSLRERNRE
jgi:hypothetical protein